MSLAKVNVDNNQPVAAEYRVNGIPDVKLFVDGKPVAGFVGAQRESQVRAFLQANMPSEAQSLVSEAQRAIAGGDTQSARAALEKALEIDPDCATAHLDMARMALGAGDLERAREHAERIPPSADVRETADYIAQAIDLVGEARAIGSEQEVAARLESDPEDVEAYFALGAHRLAAASFREALDAFLALAQRQRKWRDEAARKAMLTVFGPDRRAPSHVRRIPPRAHAHLLNGLTGARDVDIPLDQDHSFLSALAERAGPGRSQG